MPNTPLITVLQAHADTSPRRLHMPGHKGSLPYDLPAAWDVTELPPTGDLYRDLDGPIRAAEQLWADVFGFSHAFFLTGGASQGIAAALSALTAPGGTILLDACAHLAFTHAMALLDLRPVRLPRAPGPTGLPLAADPQTVGELLTAHPEIKLVCLTSPTYYGAGADLARIAEICHTRRVKLFVDAAHGAHLPFAGIKTGLSAADAAVVSAHKTLNALGQSAVLFCQDDSLVSRLRRGTQLFGSSSPSYLLMASLDAARDWQSAHAADWRELREKLTTLRNQYRDLILPVEPFDDPFRLTVHTAAAGLTGIETAADWQSRLNLWPVLADTRHVVAITTPADLPETLTILSGAINDLAHRRLPTVNAPPSLRPSTINASPSPRSPTVNGQLSTVNSPAPRRVLTPRQALFAPSRSVPLARADNQIAARDITVYPPGIPLTAAGEIIDANYLIAAGLPETAEVFVCDGAE